MTFSVWLLLTVSLVPTLAGLGAALWLGADAASLVRVLETPGIGLSIASSVWTGVIATLIALLVAHFAVAVAFTGGWRSRLSLISLPLLAVPHLAIGIGLALALAPSGLLLRLLSPWASGLEQPPDWLIVHDPTGISLIAGLVIKESAFLILILSAALAQIPAERLLMQARSLGYGRLRGWWIAIAPLLDRQVRLPVAAVLVFGIGNVEMAIPLGPYLPPTFGVVLWRWFTDPDPLIHQQAFTGTLLLFVVSVTVLAGWSLTAAVVRKLWRQSAESGRRRREERLARVSGGALMLITAAFGLLALMALVIRASAARWPFPALLPVEGVPAAWSSLLPVAGGVAGNTLLLAAAAALVATLLILPAAERLVSRPSLRRHVGALLFVPLMLPQMTFLFGVQVLLTRLRLDGTFAGVLWSHLIFALPYLWGVLAAARASLDPRYAAVARTLGRGPAAAWLGVTLPMLLRALLFALALGFSVSIALYLPTLFVGAGRIATAATEAAAAAASGSMRLAALHALLLALAPLAAFALAYTAGSLVFRRRQEVPG